MLTRLSRILMNEADGSPGGGTVPPAVPPASTAAPEAPKYLTSEQLDEKLAAFQNGFFANARKAGLLKQDKPVEHPTPAPTPQQAPGAPAPVSLSMADVEAMLERERVITARSTAFGLSDAQTKRMKSALAGVPADSFAAEADSYLADMGLAKASQPAAVAAPTVTAVTPQPNAAPISDKGSPAPGSGANWNREFADNPLNMSAAAIAQMNAELGKEVATRKRVEASLARGVNIKVTPR